MALLPINNTSCRQRQLTVQADLPTLTPGLQNTVTITGYGEDGVDYITAKNSWGVGWGELGFFNMQYPGHIDSTNRLKVEIEGTNKIEGPSKK